MSTGASAPVPKDAPVMLAWEAHKQTDDFKNAKHWALTIFPMIQAGAPDAERQRYSLMPIEQRETHVDGALWAMFYAGYFACAVANQAALSAAESALAIARDECEVNRFERGRQRERAEAAESALEGANKRAAMFEVEWWQVSATAAALQSRLSAAERDAGRYRWLRGQISANECWILFGAEIDDYNDQQFDAAIDAALSADKGDKHD